MQGVFVIILKKDSAKENKEHISIWHHSKSASMLEPSKSDMHETRKAMIRFALEHNVRDIRTYGGYKGDLLLEITTCDYNLLPVFKAHAESLGMETVIKEKFDICIHEIYCIMPNEDIYRLK